MIGMRIRSLSLSSGPKTDRNHPAHHIDDPWTHPSLLSPRTKGVPERVGARPLAGPGPLFRWPRSQRPPFGAGLFFHRPSEADATLPTPNNPTDMAEGGRRTPVHASNEPPSTSRLTGTSVRHPHGSDVASRRVRPGFFGSTLGQEGGR